MQPPPFESSGYSPLHGPAPRRSGSLLWIILGGGLALCLLLIVGAGAAGFWAFGKVKPVAECTIETQVLARSLRDYANANGGKLPPAKSWQTAISKYLAANATKFNKDAGPFAVRGANEPPGCGKGAEATGFAFNAKFSDRKLDSIKASEREVVIFETRTAAVNANGPYRPFPPSERPKIFGEPRPTFGVSATLEPVQIGREGRPTRIGSSPFNVEDSPDP